LDDKIPPSFSQDTFDGWISDVIQLMGTISHGQVLGGENPFLGLLFGQRLLFDLSDFLHFAASTLSFFALHCIAILKAEGFVVV
jgi:hypothetical protein